MTLSNLSVNQPIPFGKNSEIQSFSPLNDIVQVDIRSESELIVAIPDIIIAIYGSGKVRKDFFEVSAIWKRSRIRKAKMLGPCKFFLRTPINSHFFLVRDMSKGLIFNKNSVAMYEDSLDVKYQPERFDNAILRQTPIKTELRGHGALLAHIAGSPYEFSLKADEKLIVNPASLVAYSSGLQYKIGTYGNLASTNMPLHYFFSGPGNVIIQGQDLVFEENRSIVHRMMKRYNPLYDALND